MASMASKRLLSSPIIPTLLMLYMTVGALSYGEESVNGYRITIANDLGPDNTIRLICMKNKDSGFFWTERTWHPVLDTDLYYNSSAEVVNQSDDGFDPSTVIVVMCKVMIYERNRDDTYCQWHAYTIVDDYDKCFGIGCLWLVRPDGFYYKSLNVDPPKKPFRKVHKMCPQIL
ncbi:hypothetical protein H6P81_004968 [Aristolochia fimbriata]|uniref:S-protein homolog n=1 Tax=Aristolochia fimbriata TaxID=158543 RepID=A0AAV7EUK3_ARIFI|nr:hypothetical protein H6P81_004968 [Aristolochia fimbriata]